MQGSYRFVLRMVNRTFRALTASNLSTFNEALTGGRSKPERAFGTKSAKARSISLIRNLSFFCSLFKTSDPVIESNGRRRKLQKRKLAWSNNPLQKYHQICGHGSEHNQH